MRNEPAPCSWRLGFIVMPNSSSPHARRSHRGGETGRACRCRDGRLAADRALAVAPLAVEGWANLQDRPDRPHRSPARVPPETRTRDRAHAPRPEAWTSAHRRPLRDARLDRPRAVPAWATHPQQQASRPRRLATRRPEEAGVHAPRRRLAGPGRGHAPHSGAGYASSTPPWTTAHASPTARSSPMNAPLRRSRSSVGRARFSAHGVGTRWRRWLWGCHRAWRAMVGVCTERWPL